MKSTAAFRKSVFGLALPVTFQSMLQASFSLVDQVMIGQLGSLEIAAIGLAGKFASILSVMLAAVGSVAGILLAQAMGSGNQERQSRSYHQNLLLALAMAAIFMALCLCCPVPIMELYTTDTAVAKLAAAYLRYLSPGFLPMAIAVLLSTLLRCMERASLPLYAGIVSALVNTGLNYLLIFGKLGLPAMGVEGAALASAVAQLGNCLLLWAMLRRCGGVPKWVRPHWDRAFFAVLLPLMMTELVWTLGENVYGVIYGRLGTEACAAMTLLNPIQSLVIGALSGLSQAAGILVGKELGSVEYYQAEQTAKAVLRYGLIGSAVLSVLLVVVGRLYLSLFAVEEAVRTLAWQILLVYAAISPIKVQNMILGGVLRSGGKTRDVLVIDLTGTWLFGVPLGLLAAFVWGLSIPWVYLLLSLEECVRLLMGTIQRCRGTWMCTLH